MRIRPFWLARLACSEPFWLARLLDGLGILGLARAWATRPATSRVLAGSIWSRVAGSGGLDWLDLAALCAHGRLGWLDLAACALQGALAGSKSVALSS